MTQPLGTYQKSFGLILMACALLIIPLSGGLVLLTQLGRQDKQISAAGAVVSKCDLTGDAKVDSQDYDLAILAFGKVSVDSGNSKADIDGDGWVNSRDLDAVSSSDVTLCTK